MKQLKLSPAKRAFYNHVLAHLRNFSPEIDVTKFITLQSWDTDQILQLFLEVLWDSPEIFYVAKTVRIESREYLDGTTESARLFNIQYAFPREELQENKRKLDVEVKKAVMYAAKESAPEMIALRLHDYLVQTCEYDTVEAERNDTSPVSRTVYSALVRKKAVCEGYTMAYRYLLNKFNIPCEEILSNSMCHVWNYVHIRDKWYHVDVTYDDPVFVDAAGGILTKGLNFILGTDQISRENFLMSDTQARRTNHYDWKLKGLPPATDTSYDNKNWP